jgi:hypothetical protein
MATVLKVKSKDKATYFEGNQRKLYKETNARNFIPKMHETVTINPIDPKRVSMDKKSLNVKSAVKAVGVFLFTLGGYFVIKKTNVFSYFYGREKNTNSKDAGGNEIMELKNSLSTRRTSKTIEQTNSLFVNRIEQMYKGEDGAVRFEKIEVEGIKDFSNVKEKNKESQKIFNRRSISIQNSILDQKTTVGEFFNLPIVGTSVFSSDSAVYLEAINIPSWLNSSNPNPTFKGSYDTSACGEIVVSGNYAYIIDSVGMDLQIMDISDPANPTFKGSDCCPFNMPSGIVVSGNYAYVVDEYHANLEIIDITNVTNPTFKGSYSTFGAPRGLVVSENYAYVAARYSGLEIIDITNVTNPTIKGSYSTFDLATGIAVSENYAYVIEEFGLEIIDITNVTNPTFKALYHTPDYTSKIALSENYAYITAYSSGLQIINITDPSNPIFKASYDTLDVVYGVDVSGNYAYITTVGAEYRNFSLQIIDISDPSNPTFKTSYDTPYGVYDISISGNYAYVANGDSGLQIIALNSENLTLSGTPRSERTYSVDIRACNEEKKCATDSFDIIVKPNYVYVDIGLVISLPIIGLIICAISFCGSLIGVGGIVVFKRYRNKILKDESNTSAKERKEEEEWQKPESIIHSNYTQEALEYELALNEQKKVLTVPEYKEDVELNVISNLQQI